MLLAIKNYIMTLRNGCILTQICSTIVRTSSRNFIHVCSTTKSEYTVHLLEVIVGHTR